MSGKPYGRAKIANYGLVTRLPLVLPPTALNPLLFLYNIFIHIYSFAIRLVSFKNQKAAEWISGRKDLFTRLEEQILQGDRIIWMHCASAGELEQGKPVAEALKKAYPHHKLLLSFFSPSGYRAGKKWNLADVVTYLPR